MQEPFNATEYRSCTESTKQKPFSAGVLREQGAEICAGLLLKELCKTSILLKKPNGKMGREFSLSNKMYFYFICAISLGLIFNLFVTDAALLFSSGIQ